MFIVLTENYFHDGTEQFFIPYDEELFVFLEHFFKETRGEMDGDADYSWNIGKMEFNTDPVPFLNYQQTHCRNYSYRLVQLNLQTLKNCPKSEDKTEYYEDIMYYLWKTD